MFVCIVVTPRAIRVLTCEQSGTEEQVLAREGGMNVASSAMVILTSRSVVSNLPSR
jgi:hypothetical protein